MILIAELLKAVPIVLFQFLADFISAIFTSLTFLKEICVDLVEYVSKFFKLRKGEHILGNVSSLNVIKSALFHWNILVLADITTHRIVRNNLQMLMHDAGTRVKATVEKHKSFHSRVGYGCRLEIHDI